MFGRRRRDDDDYRDDDYRDRGRGGMFGGFGRSIGRFALFSIISSLIYRVINRIFRRY